MSHIKQYQIQFIVTTSGSRQVQNMTATTTQEAKKLLEGQYGKNLKMITTVKEVR